MSYPAPTSTDAKHNPYHTSTTTAHSDSPETTHEESSSGETPPKMVQKSTATHPVEASEPQIHPHHSLQQPSSESFEALWEQLEKTKKQPHQDPTTPSPSTPLPLPFPEHHVSTVPTNSKAGVDPVLFNDLEKLQRREISIRDLSQIPPKPVSAPETPPTPEPHIDEECTALLNREETLENIIQSIAIDGEWTVLHRKAAENLKNITQLIASGLSLDAQNESGYTVMHVAYFRKDTNALNQLLAAGANPSIWHPQFPSVLYFALVDRPEMARPIVEATPEGIKEHHGPGGFTEVHGSIWLPEILHILLSKGMQDSENDIGETALFCASYDRQPLSVQYLLEHGIRNQSAADFAKYINTRSKDNGRTALEQACVNNEESIAELLIQYGAELQTADEQSSLLAYAVDHKNTELIKLLLAHGAADLESDIPDLLFKLAEAGLSEAVIALGKYVNLNHREQIKLLKRWAKGRDCATLAAIAPLIPLKKPTIDFLTKDPHFLNLPFTEDSPELLAAMLDFFERRPCIHFVIQSYISHLIESADRTKMNDLGNALLGFALPRLASLYGDRETVMRLLQLSELQKNYMIVTEIKQRNFSGKWWARDKIPFLPEWLSDPLSLDLLGIEKKNDAGFLSNLTRKVAPLTSLFGYATIVDGAQLSNDLIFALKSTDVGKALDEVFDTHQLSAILRQALKPVLQGLISQLYPGTTTRPDAVCRFLIAYAFSTLEDNPRFNQHPAFKLLQSDPQWAQMRQKVQSEIEVLENVASTVLDTMVSVQLWETLPTEALRLTVESLKQVDPANYLAEQFRLLGALDIPAHRLAQACVNALRRWGEQGGIIPSSGHLPLSTQLQLKALIGNELAALKQKASLPDYLTSNALSVETDLNPEFHAMLWWQWDLMHRAFGIDNAENLARPAERTQNPAPEKHAKES